MLQISKKMLVMFIGLALIVSPFKMKAQDDLKAAIYLTNSQKYDLADAAFKDLIKKDANNGLAYYYYGQNIVKSYYADTLSMTFKEMQTACVPVYKKGTEVDTSIALNFVGLGRLALLAGNKAEADKNFNKAKSFLIPYKKIKNLRDKNPAQQALIYAKLAEAYIMGERVDTTHALPYMRKAQEIDEGLKELKMADQRNPEIYLIAGDIYWLIPDGTNSIRNYNKANDIDSLSAPVKVKIGDIYLRGQNLNSAREYFLAAVRLDAKFAPAYRELGEVYAAAGQNVKAKENFKKYLDLSGENVPAKLRYVQSLFRTKDYDEALNQIEAIFKVDKSRNNLNRMAAYSCYEKKTPDYEKGLGYIETFFKNASPDKIIKKDYTYWGRLILKTKADYSQSKPKNILDSAKIGKELRVAQADLAKTNKTAKKLNADKYAHAVDSLQQKFNELAKIIKTDSAEIARGFEKFKIAAKMDPTDKDILSEASMLAYNYKNYFVAADFYKSKAQITGETNDYMMVGKSYYQAKSFEKAETAFNEVIKKSPDFIPAYSWLANSYSGSDPDNKLGLAKPKFEDLIAKASVDSVKNVQELYEAYRYMGSYYLLTKEDYGKAKEWYTRILNLNPSKDLQARGYGSLGIMYGKAKQYQNALDAYKKVLDFDPNNEAAKSNIEYYKKVLSSQVVVNPNEISGLVKDDAGNPVMNCSVRVKDASNETFTNGEGKYRFEIPKDGGVLIFTAKGFKTKEVPVTKLRTYNVSLEK